MGGRVAYDYYEGYMSFEYDEHQTLDSSPGTSRLPTWLCELIGVDFFASVALKCPWVLIKSDRLLAAERAKEAAEKASSYFRSKSPTKISPHCRRHTRLRSVDPINRLEMRELSLSVTVSSSAVFCKL